MLTNGEMMKRFEDVIRDDSLDADEKIMTLKKEFAGFPLAFPKRDLEYSNKTERNRKIVNDRMLGVSITDLIQKYHMSESSVYRIIRHQLDAEIMEKETN